MSTGRWSEPCEEHEVRYKGTGRSQASTMSKKKVVGYVFVVVEHGSKFRQELSFA
jgi:hypothetical protein